MKRSVCKVSQVNGEIDNLHKNVIPAEDTSRAKSKAWNLRDITVKYCKLFVSTSNIHGFNHIVDRKRHLIEKLLWLAVVAFGFWGSVTLGRMSWNRYQTSPTVVSMDRNMLEWNTTFPCITICPNTKLNENKLRAYLETAQSENKTRLEEFIRALSVANYTNFQNVPEHSEIRSSDYMQLLLNLSWTFTPKMSGGAAQQLTIERNIIELGVCYTINSKLSIYNSPGYWASNLWKPVPVKPTFAVHPLDGEVYVQVVNLGCAYEAYIHGPHEVPDISNQRHSYLDEYYTTLEIEGLEIYTTEEAEQLKVTQRKCRFFYESNLAHSPVYSYNLCRMECRIRESVERCGCVPHFYRNRGYDNVCDVAGMNCLSQYADLLLTLKLNGKRICNCVQHCEDFNYFIRSAVSPNTLHVFRMTTRLINKEKSF